MKALNNKTILLTLALVGTGLLGISIVASRKDPQFEEHTIQKVRSSLEKSINEKDNIIQEKERSLERLEEEYSRFKQDHEKIHNKNLGLIKDYKDLFKDKEKLFNENKSLIQRLDDIQDCYEFILNKTLNTKYPYRDFKGLLRKKDRLINEGTKIEIEFIKEWYRGDEKYRQTIYSAHADELNGSDKEILRRFFKTNPFTEKDKNDLKNSLIWRVDLNNPFDPIYIARYKIFHEK